VNKLNEIKIIFFTKWPAGLLSDKIETRRGASIYHFCETLHSDVDNLYEVLMDGTDEEEKKQVETIVSKLQELNKDR
jgi:hypothetical protein